MLWSLSFVQSTRVVAGRVVQAVGRVLRASQRLVDQLRLVDHSDELHAEASQVEASLVAPEKVFGAYRDGFFAVYCNREGRIDGI